eukprot:5980493-Prymnesium_polylepis.1
MDVEEPHEEVQLIEYWYPDNVDAKLVQARHDDVELHDVVCFRTTSGLACGRCPALHALNGG